MNSNWEVIGIITGLFILQTMWITHLFSQLRADFRIHTHPDHGTQMKIERLEQRLENLEKRIT